MVREEVAAAAIAAGRSVEDVTVIGVTKYVDADWTVALADAGCLHLGENRPQVLWKKVESTDFPEPIQWHMIGHLQTNKVRRLLRYQPLIHSVDSTRLLEVIAEESVLKGIETKVLLEINISGDERKTGLTPSQAVDLLGEIRPDGVCLSGLMAMAGLGVNESTTRRQFDEVRQLRDRLAQLSGLALNELSMGMSADYTHAIHSGATMVRIGSRLFQGLLGSASGN